MHKATVIRLSPKSLGTRLGCHVANGLWLAEEAKLSSTWRELRAVRMVLESLAVKLKNKRVRRFTDNQNVARILLYGSKQPALQKEAFDTSIKKVLKKNSAIRDG